MSSSAGGNSGVFRLFDRLGSARQVLVHMRKENILFPRPADAKRLAALVWRAPCYRNIISVLANPFSRWRLRHGKSRVQASIVDGTVRKNYGHVNPRSWTLLLDHHEGYISWERYERTRSAARDSFSKPAGASKAARGGQALMAGLLRCRRCGRMPVSVRRSRHSSATLQLSTRSRDAGTGPVHQLRRTAADQAIAREILLAVEPLAIEAAVVAERDAAEQNQERRRALELEREQAAYETKLAARRYHAVDPDNRLVASELEARWNER